MAVIRTLTDTFSAAPQIDVADVSDLVELGYTAVICNRPDDEDAGQPSASQIEAATTAAGLAFVHIPVAGGFSMPQVEAMAAALARADGGRVLAYCRSGTRSANLWALAMAQSGGDPDALIAAAGRGGYDISGLRPTLAQLAGR
jgi:uncharacterized protein (TIGR01244 family)